MKFNKVFTSVAALVAVASLAACGGSSGRGESSASSEKGFAADAAIGVSLPWLGTQNWKEAETMFEDQLSEAGFKPLIQAADNKVPQQQQQIEAMIEQGAKVIVVGPIDGTQLGSVLGKAKEAGVAVIGYDRLIENTDASMPLSNSVPSRPESCKVRPCLMVWQRRRVQDHTILSCLAAVLQIRMLRISSRVQ